ncbi:hypothetical protein ACFY3U_11280 [Micromonospora sp. NPDC000089]|uniref:hypothetical protein n=1 Tax=unclassified Micromonospora TaxID=2617518 RepID=UPI00367C11F4
MNAHRMDQETAERLLAGSVAEPGTGPRPIVALLTAVRAAPSPAELRGEPAAVHAFRRARAGSPLPLPDRGARPGVLAGLAGVKVALAAVAVAATGGVALAAATGTLPAPPHRADDRPARPSATASRPAAAPTHRPGASATPSRVDATGAPRPEEALVGLCRAYRAGDDPGRALDNPIFGDLIRTAGGRDGVARYCERVVGEHGRPGPVSPGAGRPGSPPSDPPAGQPPVTPPVPTPTGTPGVDGPAGAGRGAPHSGAPSARPTPR